MNWTTEKPTFTEECVFVTASKYYDHWRYNLYEIKRTDGIDGWYLGIFEDGEEWGTVEELIADKYLILPKHE